MSEVELDDPNSDIIEVYEWSQTEVLAGGVPGTPSNLLVVRHMGDIDTARPEVQTVFWIGWVDPINAHAYDVIYRIPAP